MTQYIRMKQLRQMTVSEAIRILSAANKTKIRTEIDPQDISAENYDCSTIVGIELIEGEKHIHCFGYGYHAVEAEKPFKFAEYTGLIAPLEEVLKIGVSKYEVENEHTVNQYILDCTAEELKNIYEHYHNGKLPKQMAADDIDINTPVGCYILF